MLFLRGVYPIQIREEMNFESFAITAAKAAQEVGCAISGDYILLVSTPLKDSVYRPLNSIILYQVE